VSASLFIDGAHLSISWRSFACGHIDFRLFRRELEERTCDTFVEAYCYDANETATPNAYFKAMGHAGIRVELRYYAYEQVEGENGVTIIDPRTSKPVRRRIQKRVDTGLSVEILKSYHRHRWSRLVLVAGDDDFTEVVQYLVEEEGVRLTLVGLRERTSYNLVSFAENEVDLRQLAPEISRPNQLKSVVNG
jgi:uncharacterized LabA/DUF88 family protein